MLSTKNLLNKRLLKNPLKKVFPSKQQGNDGDLQLARISGKGEFLLGKIDGNWFSTKLTSIKDSGVNKSKKIKTSKLYGLGGLALTLVSESISTSIYSGKTATSKANSQPILKIGNGKNTGIVSSLGNQDLLLTTGNSTSSYLNITDGSNGSITSVLNGSGKFDIIFNSSDADDPRVRVLNVGTGCSSLDLTVSTAGSDSYISHGYIADDPSNNRCYVSGIDNTNPNSYNINFTSGSSAGNLTPSSGTNLVKISNDGDMTLLKDLFVTGDATVDGGRLDIDKSSGDPKLVFQIGGTSKFTLGLDDSDSDKFKINSGSTIGDSSDLELDSSGNFSVAGTLTIGTINTDTAGDNYLVEVSNEVKKRTPAQVLSDIGAQAAGNYITGTGSLSAQDLTDISNLSGTNTGDQTLPTNYLRDDADDTTSGTITAAGFTTTGTWTFDDATSGTVGITTVHTGSSFTDNDTSLMTAGAIKEKIEDYGYITTAGDIDRVKFTTDSGNHSITTGNADWTISGGEGIDTSISTSTITIAAEEASSINKGVASFSTDNFSVSSGDVTIKDLGVATDELDNRAVTYAKMQNVTNARMLGNNSGSAASPTEMTKSDVLSFLNVADGAGVAPTNYITNDAADIMSVSDFGAVAAFKIDADQPATTAAEDSKGLWIDYDRIVASSGTNAHNDIGIDLDVNTASLGTSSAIGLDVDIVGATSGTHTSTGMDINVSGSDKNHGIDITVPDGTADYHMRLFAADDVNDYATFSVKDTGDLYITTEDSTGGGANIYLDADGDVTLSTDATAGTQGEITLDATLAINLDSAYTGGSEIHFEQATSIWASMFRSNSGASTHFKLYEGANLGTNDDYFEIKALEHAVTTISTVDAAAVSAAAAAADLTFDIDGDITLDASTGNIYVKNNGGNYTPGSDYEIATKKYVDDNAGGSGISWDGSTANGVATYKDADEATVESNLTFDGTDLSIASTGKLILGAGDTSISESAADVLNLTVGGQNMMLFTEAPGGAGTIEFDNCSTGVIIGQGTKLYLDGGSNTYVESPSADSIIMACGSATMLTLQEDGATNGDYASFGTTSVGFTQFEPTYNATDTYVYFNRAGNKAHLTFGAASTAIVDIHMHFPPVSGNFTLLIKQHSSGGGSVTNWKTFDKAGSNESTVVWAGGSAPTLTTGANKIDIISVYWDADNNKAYGVASLNF